MHRAGKCEISGKSNGEYANRWRQWIERDTVYGASCSPRNWVQGYDPRICSDYIHIQREGEEEGGCAKLTEL